MRYLSWIITVPLTLLVLSFAVSNRETVTLELWPLPFSLTAPLYLTVLLAVLVAFLAGGLVVWFSGYRHRRLARQRGAEIEELSAELKRLRERQAEHDAAAKRAQEEERRAAAEAAASAVARLEHQPVPPPRAGAA